MTVSVLVFYLVVLLHGPNGDKAISLGAFPSREYCEMDRAELLTELRAKGGAVGNDMHVIATGCITRGAKIA